MTTLFYAINGSGLGHLTRAAAVIAALRAEAPAHPIVVLTTAASRAPLEGLEPLSVVQFPPGDDEPSFVADRRLRGLSRDAQRTALAATITAIAPRVVVVDTHAPIEIVRAAHAVGARVLWVLRALRAEAWARFLASEAAGLASEVLVPMDEAELVEELGEDAWAALQAQVPARCVGGVVRPRAFDAETGQRTAARHGVAPDAPLLLFTAGGGGYDVAQPAFAARASTLAARLAHEHPELVALWIRGPLAALTPPAPLVAVDHEPELPALMARASLVVAHAGNNTVEELLATGARAVLVPVPRASESQEARAMRHHASGRFALLELDDDDDTWLEIARAAWARARPAAVARRGAEAIARRVLAHHGRPRRSRVVLGPDKAAVAAASARGAYVTVVLEPHAPLDARTALAALAALAGASPPDEVVIVADTIADAAACAALRLAVRAQGWPFGVDVTDVRCPRVDVDR